MFIAIRRLGLLATVGLGIWLIAKIRSGRRRATTPETPWPSVPTDPPAAEAATPTAEAATPADDPAPADDATPPPADETPAPAPPETKPQTLALRRASQVISLQLPLTDEADQPATAPGAPWVEPVAGSCPPGYPVKAKLTSHLYHEPGMLAYRRTNPDRCYVDGSAAERDGFVKAKR